MNKVDKIYIVNSKVSEVKPTRFNRFILKLISSKELTLDESLSFISHVQYRVIDVREYYKRFRDNITQYNTFKWKN